MPKININYNQYPTFPKDCKNITKILVPKLIEKHNLVVVNILERENINTNKSKIYGDSMVRTGTINLYLSMIYDHTRSNETNRIRFMKVLIHECMHLKLGFSGRYGVTMNIQEREKFNKLLEFYIDQNVFKIMESIENLGIDIEKEPFNINKEKYNRIIMELQTIWIRKMLKNFSAFEDSNKTILNTILCTILWQINRVLNNEMVPYTDKGFGFVDHSKNWKDARSDENKAKSEAKRTAKANDIYSK